MIRTTNYKVEITFTEDMLGTVPKSKKIYEDYIASKAPAPELAEEEIQSVNELEEKGWTGFHLMDDGTPFLYNYMIKGFFKDACGMLSRASGKRVKGEERVPKNESSKVQAFKKIIDGLVFVSPRKIPVVLSRRSEMLERPLRSTGPSGERVSLQRSDTAPVESKIEFVVKVMGEVTEDLLREWFEYGEYRGLGQWRNGGYGSFNYTMTKI